MVWPQPLRQCGGPRPLPATNRQVIAATNSHQGAVHMQITTIGLDIAKNVFQIHGIDAAEKVVVRKQLCADRHRFNSFAGALLERLGRISRNPC